jgi:hypothetical protein
MLVGPCTLLCCIERPLNDTAPHAHPILPPQDLGNLEAMTEALVCVSYVRLLSHVSLGAPRGQAGAGGGGWVLEYVHTATWQVPYTGAAGKAGRAESVMGLLSGL